MIGRLRGELLAIAPPVLLVEVHGVGYEVEVPLSLLAELPPPGQPITLITHLHISDSAHTLYGFMHASQRELFRKLMKVSGIGAKLALAILSGINPAQFAATIQAADVQALTRIPGVGKKTAERLVMEMRDQLQLSSDPNSAVLTNAPSGAVAEASSALQQLGYKQSEAERIIRSVAADGMTTEAMIRAALQTLGSQR
ncbi:MAG: Holliday junction branch migration protein RuvA [Gammaproteobacteria bacterium]|jgi:Holliday junction DNA helicase RuvA|nr:Holliday junction branch migration protein RuvA [Gammaproteobacteria bacterium]